MTILIKNAKIICSTSSFHLQKKDILIEDGFFLKIADVIAPKSEYKIIEQNNLHVSLGWVDSFAHFCDPGYEQKETIDSGVKAAACGGFTDVIIIPNTKPYLDSKSQIEYILHKSNGLVVNVYPLGAVTKNTEGKDLAEMYDMHTSGAIAFSDGINSIQSAGLLLKALQYVKTFNGLIVQLPDDKSIAPNGLMNEGIVSTQLGLPSKPIMAEEIMVARDIKLARYTESKLHFTSITSPKSLAYIKRAKDSGIKITCAATPHHLYFCDKDLESYDTNLKVNPPFRTQEDMQAMLSAFIAGEIDCIATHHLPQHNDDKICEFEFAKNGMIGLQTAFGVTWSLTNKHWQIENLMDIFTINPRKIFGLPIPKIEEKESVCLTLFNPDEEYIFEEKDIKSISKNSAFIGKKLKGKVIGIFNNNKIELNS